MSSGQRPSENSPAAHVLTWARTRKLKTWFERETTSTNAVAKATDVSAPTVFLTESQTAGRGRGSHTWSTPHGALLSTWAFVLSYPPQPILSPLVGLALFEASLRAFPDLSFSLKAPNDLYIGDKKVAGLLIENVFVNGFVQCMIGLGFNAGEAPADVDSATGLALHAETTKPGETYNWPAFLDAWYDGVLFALESARHPELPPEVRVRLRDALNSHPLQKEKILRVGALGQIQTPSQTIDWQAL